MRLLVLAVVRTGAAAEHPDHDVVGAVGNEIEADEFLDLDGWLSEFLRQGVDIETHLVKVGRTLGDGRDRYERDAQDGSPGPRVLEGGKRDRGEAGTKLRRPRA